MKKLYSTIMMLAMMVAALGLTACGGDDADIYYIEGAYYDSKLRGNQYGLPNGFMQAKEAYERAIKCGHPYAAKALARMKSKWGIR